MKIIVTGGRGFIAKHLIERLLSDNHEVTVISRSHIDNPISSIRWIKQDYYETAKLTGIFQNKDVIFHLASSLRHYPQQQIVSVNQKLTSAIVSACKQNTTPPKFVFISSQAAGGPSINQLPRNETATDNPISYYGKSKLAAENEVRKLESWWTIQRPPAVFGPKEKDIVNYIRLIQKGFELHIGRQERLFSWVYVKDVVDSLVESIKLNSLDKQIWYVRSGDTTWQEFAKTISELVQIRNLTKINIPMSLVKILGKLFSVIEFFTKTPMLLNSDKINELLINDWRCDDSFYRQLTNWRPSYSLKDALNETIDWIKKENSYGR